VLRRKFIRYAAALYVDITQKTYRGDPNSEANKGIRSILEMDLDLDESGDLDENGNASGELLQKTFIGKIPIMLRSSFCSLNGLPDHEIIDLNECTYDQVKHDREGSICIC